ncbi:MAG TPA: hypothetical protein VG125_02875 [Pirellulales bacterium]|nr:hypothetical protein [Pirellulales bacterium]
MRRPQFSLKTMLWLMVVMAAFVGGMAMQRQLDKPVDRTRFCAYGEFESMTLRDGSTWWRLPADSLMRRKARVSNKGISH